MWHLLHLNRPKLADFYKTVANLGHKARRAGGVVGTCSLFGIAPVFLRRSIEGAETAGPTVGHPGRAEKRPRMTTFRKTLFRLKPFAGAPILIALAACEPGSGLPDLVTANTGTAPGPSLGDRAAASNDLATAAALYVQEAEAARNPLAKARSYEKLGDVLLRADQPRQAIGAFREALTARPDLASAREGLGVAFIKAGEPDAALPHLRGASQAGLASAFSALGVAHDLLGQPAEAQAAYDAGLARDPGDLDLLTNKAISMALQGRHGEAYATMRPAADSVFSTPRHRRNLVMIVAMSGDRFEAEREGRLMRLPPAEVAEVIALGQSIVATDLTNRRDLLISLTGR